MHTSSTWSIWVCWAWPAAGTRGVVVQTGEGEDQTGVEIAVHSSHG